MSEWWTYRLGSFLLFSPRTYYRLFELYNTAIWPAQLLALALGLGIAALLLRGGPATRWIGAALSACWLWSGVAFLAWRYARINWAATDFAWAFALEAAFLLWTALRGRITFGPPADLVGRAGFAIVLVSVAILPLLAPILGRGWRSAEIFGLAPDPTAVATLGALLAAKGRRRWPLMVIPVLWCLVTGATLLAMASPDFWVAPLLSAVSVVLSAGHRRFSTRRASGSSPSSPG
jgi:hypothetical protein